MSALLLNNYLALNKSLNFSGFQSLPNFKNEGIGLSDLQVFQIQMF